MAQRTRKAQYGKLPVVRRKQDHEQSTTSIDNTCGIFLSSEVVPHLNPRPPSLAILKAFSIYMKQSGLDKAFNDGLHDMLASPNLPYNPYPTLVRHLRPYSERFHLESKSRQAILQVINKKLKPASLPDLCTAEDHPNIWGLPSIMMAVDPKNLEQYRWVVSDVTPKQGTIYTEKGYSNQVTVALVGQSVFFGTFYSHPDLLHLRQEHLVTGPNVQQGISIFCKSLLVELESMKNSHHHIFVDVVMNRKKPEGTEQQQLIKWSKDGIFTNKDIFLQELEQTVKENSYILLQCIFRLDPNWPIYCKGIKQYGLNFVNTTIGEDREGLSSFCEFPMSSLHEGVFMSQSHAEAYMFLFLPHLQKLEEINQENQADEEMRIFWSSKMNRPTHVHKHLKPLKIHPVKIGGMKTDDVVGSGAYIRQKTFRLKFHWQKLIARHQQKLELIDTVHLIILLGLMDRNSSDPDLLVEAYRLMHSLVGRFCMLMQKNKELQTLVKGLLDIGDENTVVRLVVEYRDAVKQLFLYELEDCSSDLQTIGQVVCHKLDRAVQQLLKNRDADANELLSLLRGIYNYCLPALVQLTEDSLTLCPNIQKLIRIIKTTFSAEVYQPEMKEIMQKGKENKKSNKKSKQGIESPAQVFKHGVENGAVMSHDQLVVNIEICTQKETAPKVISKEAVLMRYLTDVRLDEVWEDFLFNLLTGTHFPPNPYPQLVSTLRQAAMRMDLCSEENSAISERMLSGDKLLVDAENYVYRIPGLDAYGCSSVLSVIDPGVFIQVIQCVQHLLASKTSHLNGLYKVAVCLAICGWTFLYGKLQPYLNELILHEHYYIKGPPGCAKMAVQLFASLVWYHVKDMIDHGDYPVLGMYLGDNLNIWTPHILKAKQKSFQLELERICILKQPFYLKFFVKFTWYYLPVKKYPLLHYLPTDGASPELFYLSKPESFYQGVFLSEEEAAFHYQNGGPFHGGNPYSVPNVRFVSHCINKKVNHLQLKFDWLSVHRYLLLKCLIDQSFVQVAKSWQVIHSITAQVEYVVGLISSLQDLILILNRECASLKLIDLLAKSESKSNTGQKSKNKVQKSQPKNDTHQQDEKVSINMQILGEMTTVLYQKLLSICTSQISMAATSFPSVMDSMLADIFEKFTDTNLLYPLIGSLGSECSMDRKVFRAILVHEFKLSHRASKLAAEVSMKP